MMIARRGTRELLAQTSGSRAFIVPPPNMGNDRFSALWPFLLLTHIGIPNLEFKNRIFFVAKKLTDSLSLLNNICHKFRIWLSLLIKPLNFLEPSVLSTRISPCKDQCLDKLMCMCFLLIIFYMQFADASDLKTLEYTLFTETKHFRCFFFYTQTIV